MKILGLLLAAAGVTAFILGAAGPSWWGLAGAALAGVGIAMTTLPPWRRR